jgi:hypothetical protein
MYILSVEAALMHADRRTNRRTRTDGQTDMKFLGAFHDFVNAPEDTTN